MAASERSCSRPAAQAGSSAAASRSAQNTYSQRAARDGRDSSDDRLIPRDAKAPRQRYSEPGTFRVANTSVVFVGGGGGGGAPPRASTANRVRFSSPVGTFSTRIVSPYRPATRAEATAAAPRSPRSRIIF